MEVRLLGSVEIVADDGAPLALGGPKERAVVALLALEAGHAIMPDRLIEVVWSGDPPRTASRTLQSYVSRLRRALYDARAEGHVELASGPAGAMLRLAPGTLDIDRAEELMADGLRAAASGDHLGAALAFGDALRFWRGRPLAEFAGQPWVAPAAARLEELRLSIAELRVDAELACGRHRDLVPQLEATCRAHPGRERPWLQLLLALYRDRGTGPALQVCRELRAGMATELGFEPNPALARLERRILIRDPTLDWQPLSPGRPRGGDPPFGTPP